MRYHAVIRNDQPTAAHGIVAWLSLIQTDPSRPPVDLEDWSSCEAVTGQTCRPANRWRPCGRSS